MKNALNNWLLATAALPWGVQRVMHDTLQAVADGQVRLTWGADYKDGSPCLVNAVAAMTKAGGGEGVPYRHFSDLVVAFDNINRELFKQNYNDGTLVSPLAADILLRNFAPLKNKPIEAVIDETLEKPAFEVGVYREPTDEELTRDWLNALNVDAPNCEPMEETHERSNSSVS